MGQIGEGVLKESLRLIETFLENKKYRIDYAYVNNEDDLTISMSLNFAPGSDGGVTPKFKFKFITDVDKDVYVGRNIDENQNEMFDENGESLVDIYPLKDCRRDRRGPVGNRACRLYGGIGSEVKAQGGKR